MRGVRSSSRVTLPDITRDFLAAPLAFTAEPAGHGMCQLAEWRVAGLGGRS